MTDASSTGPRGLDKAIKKLPKIKYSGKEELWWCSYCPKKGSCYHPKHLFLKSPQGEYCETCVNCRTKRTIQRHKRKQNKIKQQRFLDKFEEILWNIDSLEADLWPHLKN